MSVTFLPTPTPNPSPQGGGERVRRRGACPGLSAPMPTGDGLLVRLQPLGTVPLAALAALCASAQRHGNGVIEITSRGSIQVRGLSARSAPQFAADIGGLNIAAAAGVPVFCNPLAGIDPAEIIDATALRRTLLQRSIAATVSAKVSVAIDGGGALDLAKLSADIRLRAQAENGTIAFHVAVGGDDANAMPLGVIAPTDAVEAVTCLLGVIAQRGADARARDIVAAEGIAPFGRAISDASIAAHSCTSGNPALAPRVRGDERNRGSAIRTYRLRDGTLACGLGLAFGHADASALARLIDAAAAAGACGIRTAPERMLLAIGLTPELAPGFVAAAGQLGFIVRADDPRRHVIACAGAPICASAHSAARAIAPGLAAAAAPYLDGAFTIHVSGCAKGCAQAAPAALTVVGTADGCALIAGGTVCDAPFAVVPAEALPEAIGRFVRAQKRETGHV